MGAVISREGIRDKTILVVFDGFVDSGIIQMDNLPEQSVPVGARSMHTGIALC